MKKIKVGINAILAIAIFQLMFTSCCNYYKAISRPYKNNSDKAATIDSLRNTNRYFILRQELTAYHMSNPVLSKDRRTMDCTLEALSSFNKLHLTNGWHGKMRYKKNNPEDLSVLNEVHVYIGPDSVALGKYTLELEKVQRIELIEKNKRRTTNSYVLGGIVITGGILAIALIIFAATFTMDFGGY